MADIVRLRVWRSNCFTTDDLADLYRFTMSRGFPVREAGRGFHDAANRGYLDLDVHAINAPAFEGTIISNPHYTVERMGLVPNAPSIETTPSTPAVEAALGALGALGVSGPSHEGGPTIQHTDHPGGPSITIISMDTHHVTDDNMEAAMTAKRQLFEAILGPFLRGTPAAPESPSEAPDDTAPTP